MQDLGKLEAEKAAPEDAAEATPPGVTRHDDGTSTIDLIEPVEHGTKTFASVTVRKPLAGDGCQTDKAKDEFFTRSCLLISVLAGIPLAVVKKMDLADVERVNDEIDHLKNAWRSRKIFGT